MESRRPSPPSRKRETPRTLKRLLLAIPASVLLHIVIALVMRPDYRDVADYAVEFQVSEYTPGKPKKGVTNPQPEPQKEPEPEPTETPEPPKVPPKSKSGSPALVKKDQKQPPAPETAAPEPEGIPTGADAGVGSGICMHDLFAYQDVTPKWLLYISMASFRGTVFQREFGNTFRSFDLGQRLTRYMGMNPAEEVEALFVASEDIFDWRSFRVVASYDSGEERLKARMDEALKHMPNFKWRKSADGWEGILPGEFKWDLMGSGRVFSVSYAPPLPPSGLDPQPLPENPFAKTDAGPPPSMEDVSPDEKKNRWPRQVPCVVAPSPSPPKKREPMDIMALAKTMMTPDPGGHYPVAVLSTSNPVAVGIGRRAAKQMGFENAVIRGYFANPIRIEGIISFTKDPTAVNALADSWAADAKYYAADPLLAIAGVSHLLRNIKIEANGTTMSVYLNMTERQVLSTLLFLQLQGKALERQLKSNR